jgi:hypothetical protein
MSPANKGGGVDMVLVNNIVMQAFAVADASGGGSRSVFIAVDNKGDSISLINNLIYSDDSTLFSPLADSVLAVGVLASRDSAGVFEFVNNSVIFKPMDIYDRMAAVAWQGLESVLLVNNVIDTSQNSDLLSIYTDKAVGSAVLVNNDIPGSPIYLNEDTGIAIEDVSEFNLCLWDGCSISQNNIDDASGLDITTGMIDDVHDAVVDRGTDPVWYGVAVPYDIQNDDRPQITEYDIGADELTP